MEANNVIQFPSRGIVPMNQEELETETEKFREDYFEVIAHQLANDLFMSASMVGYDVLQDDTIKDCYLVIEAVKSLILKSQGLYNPMQELADVMSVMKHPLQFDVDMDEE